ncbi:hypothetical protein Lalb_Chr14g0363771 [Lupinus albus]|uniref:Uncharacterized protein n=1 Tax=Lupinus albus TaxID=3870 RepID=A0A6A4P939_LUPAL|nr:hypothetical protein Lalb_Chr14g0363771 [Lupinus albus]
MREISLRSRVFGRKVFRCHYFIRSHVILNHSAFVDQGGEVGDSLMPKHRLQLGLQTRFKFCALGPSVHLQLRVRAKLGQFFKLGRIFPHRPITLLQSKKLHLFLPPQIIRKIFMEEFHLKCLPRNQLSLYLHLASSEFPPIFGLRHQHVGGISQLLSLRTVHCSKDPLHPLDPLNGSFGSKSPMELGGISPTKLI